MCMTGVVTVVGNLFNTKRVVVVVGLGPSRGGWWKRSEMVWWRGREGR